MDIRERATDGLAEAVLKQRPCMAVRGDCALNKNPGTVEPGGVEAACSYASNVKASHCVRRLAIPRESVAMLVLKRVRRARRRVQGGGERA